MLDCLKRTIARSRFAPVFLPGNRYGNLVPNINLDVTRKQKRVLLIYLDMFEASVQISNAYRKGESGAVHTNRVELFQMIKGLIELDYCIDVCGNGDVQAKKYIDANEYDFIIGLGELFRWTVEKKKIFSIIYMTENPYSVSYRGEMERLDYFFQRHQKKLNLERTGKFFQENDELISDAILCVGEKKYFEKAKKPVEKIYPSAFYNVNFDVSSVQRSRKSFIVFGTEGFVHKGIDLLVDVFLKHPDWQLFICGYDVEALIKDMMGISIRNTNIHDCGYIRVDSEEFLELINKCRFILLPSCSEGTSTAILTGMRHGLIPVVTHETGLDEMSEYCYFFDDFHIDAIEKKIKEIQDYSENELDIKSRNIYNYANKVFTAENFKEQFKKAIQEIMKG